MGKTLTIIFSILNILGHIQYNNNTYPTTIYPSAIWSHEWNNQSHQIVLFRKEFFLNESHTSIRLKIFADTRYEVWIDGTFVGRGPARFTYFYHEMDAYTFDELNTGNHVIAVLVQWAPNTRRSESTRPYLQAVLEGNNNNNWEILASTDSSWKILNTDAWQLDASLVHNWNIIGPTEILNFNKLPDNWNNIMFDDTFWEYASDVSILNQSFVQTKNLIFSNNNEYYSNLFNMNPLINLSFEDITYKDRTIPFLIDFPIDINIIDQGKISPNMTIVDILPSSAEPITVDFDVITPTMVTLETLDSNKYYNLPTMKIDNIAIDWSPSNENRPDIVTFSSILMDGNHKIAVSDISPSGCTFSISQENINQNNNTQIQGNHAGRRLLLSQYLSDDSSVSIQLDHNFEVMFNDNASYVVLDLGRTIHGRLSATVSGPKNTIIDIGWDERLFNNTLRPLPYPGSLHPEWNQVDSWLLDGNQRSLTTIDSRAGRYVLIAVWGGPVYMTDLQVQEERYPVMDDGMFSSDNELLNTIWNIGKESLYPNMTDAYTDTPWRERGQWWGDAYVEDQINRVVFGDWKLLRRGLDLTLHSGIYGMVPNGIGLDMLDYQMLWIHSLAEYLQFNPDEELVNSSYPLIQSFLLKIQRFVNTDTRLLEIPKGPWSETAYLDAYSSKDRHGISTAINSLYYSTLIKISEIAILAGDSESAFLYLEEANHVKNNINIELYSVNDQCYYASKLDGNFIKPTILSQAYPIYYGVVTDDVIDSVSNCLIKLISPNPASPNISTYGMFWIINSLGEAEKYQEALDIIYNYYGYMVNHNSTTWWENFSANKKYTQSLSHGWGGGPTYFLTKYILGLSSTDSKSWKWQPSLTGVNEVSGSIPFSDSNLSGEWFGSLCSCDLIIYSPDDSNGLLILKPIFADSEIILDNEIIWKNGVPYNSSINYYEGAVHILLNGGNHKINLHQNCKNIYLPILFNSLTTISSPIIHRP